ncbi:acetyl-CoA synthetase-like protein [Aspergillus californicus]
MPAQPALFYGPNEPELWHKTIGTLIDEQERRFGDRTAVIVPWQSVQLTYRQLGERSRLLAKAMLDMGLKHGDCVGIMAGNCYQYIEIFLAGGRIGCPVVVLNSTYTAKELVNAVHRSSCKLLFISPTIGRRSLATHLAGVTDGSALTELRRVVLLGPVEAKSEQSSGLEVQGYSAFVSTGESIFMNGATLKRAERKVSPEDVLNLQFTSGTTGSPKAAMLTHINILNNGRFVGAAMHLTPADIILSPPPLFHCFGLVMGFLASFIHGSSIIFPSEYFDATKVVGALMTYSVTAILGVPAMFIAEIEVLQRSGRKKPLRLRTGLVSGASVTPALMGQIKEVMGVHGMLIPYGMTETSPVTFITSFEDDEGKRVGSVGKVLPHTGAKVVDAQGNIRAVGERGELCTSGFALQRGYWRNEEKTSEVMKTDEEGRLWMFTGDEAVLDEGGYARITGRIKDIIIRGGENIFPLEIEERLMAHASIAEASVVGLEDNKYGEVVGCFLKRAEGAAKIADKDVREHVSSHLGRHKAPQYVFWIGDAGVGSDFPKTGSGKHQKHIMREIGNRLVKQPSAKL